MATIERVFVARRPLNPGTKNWYKFRYMAHSALLLRTTDQRYHILEYMSDSQAHLYEITLHVIKTIEDPPHELFTLNGVEWTKQLHGKPLSGWTIEQARTKMQELMKDGYRIEKNEVCHVAQERLRKEMGIMEDDSACVVA